LVLVPTRRAAQALREIFADTLSGATAAAHSAPRRYRRRRIDPSAEDLDALPPVAPLRRRLLLATLVRRWGETKNAPIPFTQCLAYAGELARFLDEVVTQSADLTRLKTLATDSLAAHWNEVVQFLDIVAVQWRLSCKPRDERTCSQPRREIACARR
jgi:ATP-dependent helicase/nuclease subunit B